jgi:hypothetical protein
MKYSIENKITEYFVRDNIYLHVTETEFSPLSSSNNYDSDWDMYPENEIVYEFILDETVNFESIEERNQQRQEVRELNNSDQSELIELVLEGEGVEV